MSSSEARMLSTIFNRSPYERVLGVLLRLQDIGLHDLNDMDVYNRRIGRFPRSVVRWVAQWFERHDKAWHCAMAERPDDQWPNNR